MGSHILAAEKKVLFMPIFTQILVFLLIVCSMPDLNSAWKIQFLPVPLIPEQEFPSFLFEDLSHVLLSSRQLQLFCFFHTESEIVQSFLLWFTRSHTWDNPSHFIFCPVLCKCEWIFRSSLMGIFPSLFYFPPHRLAGKVLKANQSSFLEDSQNPGVKDDELGLAWSRRKGQKTGSKHNKKHIFPLLYFLLSSLPGSQKRSRFWWSRTENSPRQ